MWWYGVCVWGGSGSHTNFRHCVVIQVHHRHLRSQPDDFPSTLFYVIVKPVYQLIENMWKVEGMSLLIPHPLQAAILRSCPS